MGCILVSIPHGIVITQSASFARLEAKLLIIKTILTLFAVASFACSINRSVSPDPELIINKSAGWEWGELISPTILTE